jgi:hypothetical protein
MVYATGPYNTKQKESRLNYAHCTILVLMPIRCVFITAIPITKLFTWGEGGSGGHVLRETTSRGLCGLVCPSRISERGGEGDCIKEGGGEEGERERARALGVRLRHSPGY